MQSKQILPRHSLLLIVATAIIALATAMSYGINTLSSRQLREEAKLSASESTSSRQATSKTSTNSPLSSSSSTSPAVSSGSASGATTKTGAKSVSSSAGTQQIATNTASIPAPPSCVPSTTYKPVQALGISTSSPGLTQVIDPPFYYDVYGYTADQIRAQLDQCFPGATNSMGDIDAATTMWINFVYTVYTKPSGLCSLKDVAVGAHVGYLYPRWANSAYATAGLNSQWQTYAANLATHESGHKDITIDYASTIYNNLQTYPDTNCATIDQSAKNFANNLIGIMYLSQATYDSQNKHGLTQGVKFP